MAPVQRFDQSIATAPLPSARRSAAENDISAGVGVAEAEQHSAQSLAQLGGTITQAGTEWAKQAREAADREKERADQVAVFDAQNQVVKQTNAWMYDPDTGALGVKGKAAMALPEAVGANYTKLTSDVSASLTTPRQKEAFARFADQHGQSLDLELRRHVFGEMKTYEGEVLQATVENAHDEAVSSANDPARVGMALGRAVEAIKTSAPRLGMPPEMVQEKIKQVTSATFVGVIDQLIATDKTKAAQTYFDETKSQIKGDALGRLQKALEESGLRKDSQTQSDQIMGSGKSFTDQLEAAKAIDNPKLRDEVVARIEHNNTVLEKQARDAETQRVRTVYDIIDQTHNVSAIPTTIWSQMDGSARSAAHAYADRLAKGVAVETDFPTYYALMQKAAHDPDTFATENLLHYRAKIGDTELKQLTEMQGSIIKGDRAAADKQSNNFRTHEQIINDSLINYGLDPKAKVDTPQGKANAELYRLTAQGVSVVESHLKPGQHATDADIQGVVDHILSTHEKTPGSWWAIVPGSGVPLGRFTNKDQSVINMTAADVPAAQRTIIEGQLRAAGRAVSDATVLEAYQAMRVKPRR